MLKKFNPKKKIGKLARMLEDGMELHNLKVQKGMKNKRVIKFNRRFE